MSKQVHLLTVLTSLGSAPVSTTELEDITGLSRQSLTAELCVARIRGYIEYGGPPSQPRSYTVTPSGQEWMEARMPLVLAQAEEASRGRV